MSSMEDSDRIPTNNEIVDALINDFKATCDIKPSDNNIKTETKNVPDADIPEGNISDKFPLDDEQANETKDKKLKADDFIDEEFMKLKEESLTEDDLQALKTEAEELKGKGNEQFKNKEFMESANTYTLALRTCPLTFTKERAILYSNRGAAKVKLELTESAIEDCSKAIELDPTYLKVLLRRAQLYDNTEKLDEALADYTKVLEIDPSHAEARAACQRLPIQINERNEKLKTEMMGKLKDLGNMILRPFGLSTNNFQMVQDPNSGGYSISFKQ